MIRSFIFDMDGTVIDSTRSDFLAWEKLFKEYYIQFTYEDYLNVLGARGEEIIEKYLPHRTTEIKPLLQCKEDLFKTHVEQNGIKAINGVIQFLDKLREANVQTALATGAGSQKLDFIFSKIDVRKYFDVIVTADDVSKGKPDPEIFIKSAEKLKVHPSEAIVIEDAQNGIFAAGNAGMKCIAVITTHPRERLQDANLIVEGFEQINIEEVLQWS